MSADHWMTESWVQEARTIVASVTRLHTGEVQEAAIELADRFVARGFFSFRDLASVASL